MAVDITVTALAAAMRVGDSTQETAEVTRLLAFATRMIEDYLGDNYDDCPAVLCNEAAIRIAAYLYDAPNVPGAGMAPILRNSGAGHILARYRVHRAGSVGDAVDAAQAMGSADNPVTDISVSGSTMTVSYADGTTEALMLPAGGGGGGATPWTIRYGRLDSNGDLIGDEQSLEVRGSSAELYYPDAEPDDAKLYFTLPAGGALERVIDIGQLVVTGEFTLANGRYETDFFAGVVAILRIETSGLYTVGEAGGGTVSNADIDARISPWARVGSAELLPADKHRLATGTTRGAVAGTSTNALVDAEADSEIRGWSVNHVFRAIRRFLPNKVPALAQATRGQFLKQADDGETWELGEVQGGGTLFFVQTSEPQSDDGFPVGSIWFRDVVGSATLFEWNGTQWVEDFVFQTPAGGASERTLLATITTDSMGGNTSGTLADFNAIRNAINSGAYSKLLIEGEGPRTFGTITDGKVFVDAEFWIPDGLTIPASSSNDTYFREFGDAVSDQGGTAERLQLNLRPGGTNKITVAHALVNGSTIRIYGVT